MVLKNAPKHRVGEDEKDDGYKQKKEKQKWQVS